MPVRKTLRGSFAGALLLSAALGANVPGGGTGTGPNVTVTDNGATVVLSNGIVSVTVVKSNGNLSSFSFNGTNLLAGGHGGGSFYVDGSGGPTLTNTVYTLTVDPATNGGAQAEVWLQSTQSPMDAGLYYDLLRGQQGIYDTFVLSHPASYPVYPGAELRTNMYVGSIFDWVCVDPYRFRQMASPNDTTVAVTGAPPEVMQFTSGIYNGTTGCKYSYSEPLGPANAYGWASTTTRYGIWQTFPSHEYLDGGPMHRELTAHLGNTLLDMFGGGHYGFGSTPTVPAGAEAFKVFGPAFIYANQYGGTAVNVSAYAQALFADAQAQAAAEQSAWPYAWFNPQPPAGISGALYPQKPARGGVSGTLAINDPYDAGSAWRRTTGAWTFNSSTSPTNSGSRPARAGLSASRTSCPGLTTYGPLGRARPAPSTRPPSRWWRGRPRPWAPSRGRRPAWAPRCGSSACRTAAARNSTTASMVWRPTAASCLPTPAERLTTAPPSGPPFSPIRTSIPTGSATRWGSAATRQIGTTASPPC